MIPFYPLFLVFIKLRKFKTVLALEKLWTRIFLPLAGIFFNIEQPHKFPNAPMIICPNHSSYFDIFASLRIMPGYYAFLGKAELKHWPIFNIFFNSGMNILVNREDKMGAAQAFKKSLKAIAEGQSLIIFPEAGIPSNAPKLMAFKDGAFALAIKKQIPIQPVTFLDNYKILKTGGFFKSRALPGRCKVIFHKPIETKGLTQADLVSLRQQVFGIIQKPLL